MAFKGKKYDNINTEEQIVDFWNQNNVFQKSISNNKDNESFIFYDGPPFATGLPHYGHILAGMIKDSICRWQTINGKYVPRRAGWDTHGLPIEYEIEKKFGIKTKEQIKEFGIANYNEACREIVMTYAGEWEKIMNRFGRWVDFKDDYKTMDVDFMSKVWNVFARIYEKGLIYEGVKIMPYSIACTTPLSNFEASSNYQNVSDRTVIVKFKLKDTDSFILSWTTTPWTLPGHYALCVNKNIIYNLIEYNGEKYYIAKTRIDFLLQKLKTTLDNIKILKEVNGSDLVNLEYEPLYNFANREKYVVIQDNFVTDDSGTGVVHIAPAYGEDDYRVSMENNLITKDLNSLYIHIDDSGNGKECGDFSNLNVKDMTKSVLKNLQQTNRSVVIFDYEHSYPFCWRSDTPLIYKAVKCWFLNVESIKERMMELNKTVNWVPENVGSGRFHSWLANTRDWCLSRNRYWGTPIPVWKAEDGSIIVINSKEQLEELTGTKITDLHRHHVDKVIINKDGKEYKRVETVLDCWFESGSVPFASPTVGYPADFIAEGLDQTRGWFYTLMVIGTILEDKAPFKNVIVNGLVLAGDGKKMSKRLKNYPDPVEVVDKYGSDALRYYLIMSGASMASELRFKNDEVKEVLQTVIIPLTNSLAFFEEYYTLYSKKKIFDDVVSDLPFDKWILKRTYDFIMKYRMYMNKYEISPISELLVKYIDDLNNNYIRLNRDIMKGKSEDDTDGTKCLKALSTLKKVLQILSKNLSPILPFLMEKIYQTINKDDMSKIVSVHLINVNNEDIEQYNLVDNDIVMINDMLKVIAMIRAIRSTEFIQLKKPLSNMIIYCDEDKMDLLKKVENYIVTEGNILELEFKKWEASKYNYLYQVNMKVAGRVLGSKVKDFNQFMSQQEQDVLLKIYNGGYVFFNNGFIDVIVNKDIVTIYQTFAMEEMGKNERMDEDVVNKIKVKINIEMNENTLELYTAKNIATSFQRIRKYGGYHVYDNLRLAIKSSKFDSIIKKHMEYIMKTTRVEVEIVNDLITCDYKKDMEIDDEICEMYLIKN